MKVTSFADFLHHVVDHTNFDTESDFVKSHELVDQHFPPTVAADPVPQTAADGQATSEPATGEQTDIIPQS
jgi:hypothetical protein